MAVSLLLYDDWEFENGVICAISYFDSENKSGYCMWIDTAFVYHERIAVCKLCHSQMLAAVRSCDALRMTARGQTAK